jgi:hypothetical protein
MIWCWFGVARGYGKKRMAVGVVRTINIIGTLLRAEAGAEEAEEARHRVQIATPRSLYPSPI